MFIALFMLGFLGFCIFTGIGIVHCEIARKIFGIMIICIGIGVLVYQCVDSETSREDTQTILRRYKPNRGWGQPTNKYMIMQSKRNADAKFIIPLAIMALGLYIFNIGKNAGDGKDDKKNGEGADDGKDGKKVGFFIIGCKILAIIFELFLFWCFGFGFALAVGVIYLLVRWGVNKLSPDRVDKNQNEKK